MNRPFIGPGVINIFYLFYMKILYLIKEKSRFTGTLQTMIDAQAADGHEISLVFMDSAEVDYSLLIDAIFSSDKVICF